MNIITKNKGVLLFYIGLIVCAYICSWRFERLEAKENPTVDKLVLNIK